jgi:arsenate reductase
MVTLYGIANCDTMKKARAWLNARGVDYVFHDYKKAGVDECLLRAWAEELGWAALLNTRGTTWRRLPRAVRDGIDEASAIALMCDSPSIIKRPVLDTGRQRHLGFRPEQYEQIFAD